MTAKLRGASLVLRSDLSDISTCRIEGCNKPPFSRGLCTADYTAAKAAKRLDELGLAPKGVNQHTKPPTNLVAPRPEPPTIHHDVRAILSAALPPDCALDPVDELARKVVARMRNAEATTETLRTLPDPEQTAEIARVRTVLATAIHAGDELSLIDVARQVVSRMHLAEDDLEDAKRRKSEIKESGLRFSRLMADAMGAGADEDLLELAVSLRAHAQEADELRRQVSDLTIEIGRHQGVTEELQRQVEVARNTISDQQAEAVDLQGTIERLQHALTLTRQERRTELSRSMFLVRFEAWETAKDLSAGDVDLDDISSALRERARRHLQEMFEGIAFDGLVDDTEADVLPATPRVA